jgi:cytochrome c oxidase subunit 3
LSLRSAKKGEVTKQKNYLVITIILGLGFLLGQYFAWKQLVANGIYFAGNPAESFLYVISGFHAFHIIAGILLLLFALTGIFSKINQTKNIFRMEISTIFWHFIDILWIYLFVFLLINR